MFLISSVEIGLLSFSSLMQSVLICCNYLRNYLSVQTDLHKVVLSRLLYIYIYTFLQISPVSIVISLVNSYFLYLCILPYTLITLTSSLSILFIFFSKKPDFDLICSTVFLFPHNLVLLLLFHFLCFLLVYFVLFSFYKLRS